ESAWHVRVHDAEIHAESRDADLSPHFPAALTQCAGDSFLEGRIELVRPSTLGGRLNQRNGTALGVVHVELEVFNRLRPGPLQVDLLRTKACEYHDFLRGTCNRDIETSLAASPVQRTEVHRHITGPCHRRAIPDAE